MKMKQFEDLTIRELREQTEEYKERNPEIKTAQELLEEIENES